MEKVQITVAMEVEANAVNKFDIDGIICSALEEEGIKVVNIGAYKNRNGENVTSTFFLTEYNFADICREELLKQGYNKASVDFFINQYLTSFFEEWDIARTDDAGNDEFSRILASYAARTLMDE